jgi:hypothetical protein
MRRPFFPCDDDCLVDLWLLCKVISFSEARATGITALATKRISVLVARNYITAGSPQEVTDDARVRQQTQTEQHPCNNEKPCEAILRLPPPVRQPFCTSQ